jgi:protoporphyrinogen oxidase
MKVTYLIIGAGPAGLGAGWHLKNKGIDDFLILEKESYPGGLSASFKDSKGFYWDLGGHVIFDNESELTKTAKKLLKKNLKKYKRNVSIYLNGKYIAYPFQDNFPVKSKKAKVKNFRDWLLANFGQKACKVFFFPQNEKSWAYPLEKMSYQWVEKRIKLPEEKNKNWGANASFYYPKNKGIGFLFKKIAETFKKKIEYGGKVIRVDYKNKEVVLNNKKIFKYEYLISSMPLNILFKLVKNEGRKFSLHHNQGLVIGLGIKGRFNHNYHWIYYPEKKYSFFRLVFPSNFSDLPKGRCSLIAEITLGKKIEQKKIIKEIENLAIFKGKIISVFQKEVEYFYPIPTLDRNKNLANIQNLLKANKIYSIGRFGGWKYEEGNMDDAFIAFKKILLII